MNKNCIREQKSRVYITRYITCLNRTDKNQTGSNPTTLKNNLKTSLYKK